MPLERWQVKLEFERAGGKAARMRRWGGLIRGGKAAEGRRTPRRWRVNRWLPNHAKRLGVRQSSGALGRRADDSQQDQECAETPHRTSRTTGQNHGGKAAEGRRTPRRWRVNRWFPNHAERLGVRQSSGASGRRADDSEQDQESAENGTQDERDNRPPPRLPITEIQAEGEPAADSSGRSGNEGRSRTGFISGVFHRQTISPTRHCVGGLPSHLILLGVIQCVSLTSILSERFRPFAVVSCPKDT